MWRSCAGRGHGHVGAAWDEGRECGGAAQDEGKGGGVEEVRGTHGGCWKRVGGQVGREGRSGCGARRDDGGGANGPWGSLCVATGGLPGHASVGTGVRPLWLGTCWGGMDVGAHCRGRGASGLWCGRPRRDVVIAVNSHRDVSLAALLAAREGFGYGAAVGGATCFEVSEGGVAVRGVRGCGL